MRQNSQSLNDDDDTGTTTTSAGSRIETFRRMNRNRPLKVTLTFARFIILILLYLWVLLFGLSSKAWTTTNNDNSVHNNNTKHTNKEKDVGKWLDDPRGIVNVRRVNERGIKEQEEYIMRLETKRRERQERIRKRREELESQNGDEKNDDKSDAKNQSLNTTTTSTTPRKISRLYPPPKTPTNTTTNTTTPPSPPPSTTSIVFFTLLSLITFLRIMTTLTLHHLTSTPTPPPSRNARYRDLVARLNATRAANGERPISLASLRLILSHRDFEPNDYDDLLRFATEESGPALEALVSGIGATRAEIERLPQCELGVGHDLLVERERGGGDGRGRGRCVICLEEYEVGDVVRTIPCFHCFHAGCIDPWLGFKAECPVCKHPALG